MPLLTEMTEGQEEILTSLLNARSLVLNIRMHTAFAKYSLALTHVISGELDRTNPEHVEMLSLIAGMEEHEFLRAFHMETLGAFAESRVTLVAAQLGIEIDE